MPIYLHLTLLVVFFIHLAEGMAQKDTEPREYHHCFFEEKSFSVVLGTIYALESNLTGITCRIYYNLGENFCFGPEFSGFKTKDAESKDLNLIAHYIFETLWVGVYPIGGINYTWEEWKSTHPKTWVLSEDTGFSRDYNKNPYPGYAQSNLLLFKVSKMDGRYHPKEFVIGIEIDEMAKAYPLSELSKSGSNRIRDRFEGKNLLINYRPESQQVTVVCEDTGKALPTIRSFWFAWYAFHPKTSVYVFIE